MESLIWERNKECSLYYSIFAFAAKDGMRSLDLAVS